jgi:hypothetical protein
MMSIDPEAHGREMMNLATAPTITSAFRREWIDGMMSRTYKLDRACSHIFVVVDPAGATQRNKYAIGSYIFVDGKMVVCFFFPFCSIHEAAAPLGDGHLTQHMKTDLARQCYVHQRSQTEHVGLQFDGLWWMSV